MGIKERVPLRPNKHANLNDSQPHPASTSVTGAGSTSQNRETGMKHGNRHDVLITLPETKIFAA